MFFIGSAQEPTAEEVLGNPNYPAFSYGGYRTSHRADVPTVEQLKEDMSILSAMGIKLLRTYNTQQYKHTENLLKAIDQLKKEDPSFEMYLMLGTWIECHNAWTNQADHQRGNYENNSAEIHAAVQMAKDYPDIVKVIAVGNEAMVQWAVNYFVYPKVILKWVNYLQELKSTGELSSDLWITSSDNYESWGGGDPIYHSSELIALSQAVDFISLHTYPFHDTHYKPEFWGIPEQEENLTKIQQIDASMLRAKQYAIAQYQSTLDYLKNNDVHKEIHIGETGWSTIASSSYGTNGSKAADQYKEKRYYDHMRAWSEEQGLSCFYFEAFDERWKDQGNPLGSENHFGLINLEGQAKYALWDLVDQGVFKGLTRDGKPIKKTYNGDLNALLEQIEAPALLRDMGALKITKTNPIRKLGQQVTEENYLVYRPLDSPKDTYPSAELKLNSWEGTCSMEISKDALIEISTGTGPWWGCAIEVEGVTGEDLSLFEDGLIHFEIKGATLSSFDLGIQTGSYTLGDQVNHFIPFNTPQGYALSSNWTTYSIPINSIIKQGELSNVTSLLFLRGIEDFDGKEVYIRNLYYSQKKAE